MGDQEATAVALQFVREEVSAIRHDLTTLSADLRAYMNETASKVAVLETQQAQHAKDIEDLKASRKVTWQNWVTLVIAILGVVVAWVLPLIIK